MQPETKIRAAPKPFREMRERGAGRHDRNIPNQTRRSDVQDRVIDAFAESGVIHTGD